MNNKRRESLRSAIIYLDKAETIVSNALNQEQDCMDNMPENLQGSERYEVMETAVDNMDDAVSDINNARNRIDEVLLL